MGNEIISSNINIAPNEYVTKYSFNRNFQKLVSNDINLSSLIEKSGDNIEVYNKNRAYSKGNLVFFKPSKSSQVLYLLKYVNEITSKQRPLVDANLNVVNSDWWNIVGIPSDIGFKNPKSLAISYVNDNSEKFDQFHTKQLSVHPTRELGLTKSSKLYTNMTNLAEDRTSFQFPGYLRKLVPDNTIKSGYVRKWDNGILEYDLTYQVGYCGTQPDGRSQLCANNLQVLSRNNNYLYFKNNSDYEIFNQLGHDNVTTQRTNQCNLLSGTNIYYGNIVFPEEFKDTNYMIFSTNIKNVETEAKSSTLKTTFGYDSRLKILGNVITGYVEGSSFKFELPIPDEVICIGAQALAGIQITDSYQPKIAIKNTSQLKSIDNYAFAGSKLTSIVIPPSVRYIGKEAFKNCDALEVVDFYLSRNIYEQVKMDEGVFENSGVRKIRLHYSGLLQNAYPQEKLFKQEDLYDKLHDQILLASYGLSKNNLVIEIVDDNGTLNAKMATPFAASPLFAAKTQQNTGAIAGTPEYIEINKHDLLNALSNANSLTNTYDRPKFKLSTAPVFKVGSIEEQVFKTTDTQITGYDSEVLTPDMNLDLGNLPSDITSISPQALTGFQCNSLSIPNHYSIGVSSLAEMTINKMTIDLNNTFIEVSALLNTGINSLTLKNILLGKRQPKQIGTRSIELSSLDFYCFSDTQITEINLDGITGYDSVKDIFENTSCPNHIKEYIKIKKESGSEIEIQVITNSTVINNCTMVSEGCLLKLGSMSRSSVRTSYTKMTDEYKDKETITQTLGLTEIPSYLKTQNNSVSKCDFKVLKETNNRNVSIPLGLTAINQAVFDVSGDPEYQYIINKIFIPNTIKSIGNIAFKGNLGLAQLIFDENSQLTCINDNAISGCVSLNEFNLLSS